MAKGTKPAIFLDRDGTIIEQVHYINDPDKVVLLPGAAEAMKEMNEKGYDLFVISNQSGVGRKIITKKQFKAVEAKVESLLKGVEIVDYLYCFHVPDDKCDCRKPNTGLVPKKYKTPGLAKRCWSVGDKQSDVELGINFGAQGCLVLTGYGADERASVELMKPPPLIVPTLADFAARLQS